ncbi:hypothetical protein CL176_03765 [Suicoccus acidiformans]|uniref:HTH lysR-type domain-containing protein n=1 Tax=Suicoccus acidiformans TaxID=2036206 RepID=A0A347WJG1_9LACT|nr:LysR family transcriptional regulator [Suicoccus acidiformans]AXY25218.1 hypothetical protein CL176_03765 [Suicoccus acidiformans]
MNIRDLHYFIHLSKSLSFTKTAEAFYVSQPSISIALKRLEENFGATLIERQRSVQNIQLTGAGEILLRRAQQITELLELTEREIQDNQNQTINFGYSPTIGSYYLPELLPFIQDYTEHMSFIEEESSDQMLEMLEKQQVSIAIIGSESDVMPQKWLETYALDRFEAGIYVSKQHPLAKEHSVSLKQIKELPLISLGKGYTHYRIFEAWAQEVGLPLHKVTFTNDTHTLNTMVKAGIKAGFMTDALVTQAEDMVKLLIEDAPYFYTFLVVNDTMNVSQMQADFNQTMKQHVK